MTDDPKNVSVSDETLENASGGVYSYESLKKIKDGLSPETKKDMRDTINTGMKVLSPAYGVISQLIKD